MAALDFRGFIVLCTLTCFLKYLLVKLIEIKEGKQRDLALGVLFLSTKVYQLQNFWSTRIQLP